MFLFSCHWRSLLRHLCVLGIVAGNGVVMAAQPVNLPRTSSFEIESRHTGQRYRILLGLPWGKAPAAGYPVLWALDGAMSFPLLHAWRPQAPSGRPVPPGRGPRSDSRDGLVIAIAHAQPEGFDIDARALDYTPKPDARTGDLVSRAHGGADAFMDFINDELRPRIARDYGEYPLDATRQTLFGFSYGGLFALHVLSSRPGNFQRYWIASPSIWFSDNMMLRQFPARLARLTAAQLPQDVMLTVGRDEEFPPDGTDEAVLRKLKTRAMVSNTRAVAGLLREAGAAVRLDVLPGRDHHDMLMQGAREAASFAFAP